MYKHILLPTDGSELSERAAREGFRFAKSIGARLTALYTTPPFYPTEFEAHNVVEHAEEHERKSKIDARRVLDVIEQIARDAEVACTAVHRLSDVPWEEIIKVAAKQGCDVIFMASHGRRGVGALLLGSETNKVLTHSKIPVLVWR